MEYYEELERLLFLRVAFVLVDERLQVLEVVQAQYDDGVVVGDSTWRLVLNEELIDELAPVDEGRVVPGEVGELHARVHALDVGQVLRRN